METDAALSAFSALSHEGRLLVFRALVKAEPTGLAAGAVAKAVMALNNTTSTHLTILQQAGLVISRREGRSIIYRANLSQVQAVASFLREACCEDTGQKCDLGTPSCQP